MSTLLKALQKTPNILKQTVITEMVTRSKGTKLNSFVTSEDVRIRRAVAVNKNLNDENITILAGDRDQLVRRRIANLERKLPEMTYTILAADSDAFTRWTIARRKDSPACILDVLSEDKDLNVRLGVVLNKSVTLPILKKLETDDSNLVRAHVNEIKVKMLKQTCRKMETKKQLIGNLIMPTFTGWPEEFSETVTGLTK